MRLGACLPSQTCALAQARGTCVVVLGGFDGNGLWMETIVCVFFGIGGVRRRPNDPEADGIFS